MDALIECKDTLFKEVFLDFDVSRAENLLLLNSYFVIFAVELVN